MQNYSKEFINKLLKKDSDAFSRFYLDTVDMFYRYLKSSYFLSDSDCEDLVSTLYVKVWDGLDKLKDNTNFSSWVWTIFRNLIIDFFKKEQTVNFSDIKSDDYSIEEKIENDFDIVDFMDKQFNYDHIVDAISKLDIIYKEVLILRFVEDKSYDDIAKILGISNDNVRQRISRGLKILKNLLNN